MRYHIRDMEEGTIRARNGKKWRVVLPAFFTALSAVLLIAMFDYANFDLSRRSGASAILFASFASSAFLMFMMPRSHAAKLARFVRSYIIGGVMGAIGFTLLPLIGAYWAVGIALFVAALALEGTDSMHPPAMGLALAFIIYDVGYTGVVIAAVGVAMLVLMKRFIDWVERGVRVSA